ncbi:BMP family ABC transporter substrate-binding protein [Paenibacillus sp. G2S3]|uniref:BMP family ABC transporter substrate-binding protein n=1 Tax=Paenibacillus sp. G2S3 TaxID=3047872 RepID=UPI0032E52950
MKKKVLSLLLLVVMVMVTACGNNTSSNGSSANAGSNAVEGGETGSGDKLKVVLLIPGTLGDKSFFDSANSGLQKVKDELGAETKVVEMGVDKTKWEPTFNDIAAENWDVIISGGSEITEMFNATAELYPDKNSLTMIPI